MEIMKKILYLFMDAVREIEALNDYCHRSTKSFIDYKTEIEHKHSSGKKVADILDGLFTIASAEERNKKIEEIKDVILENNTKFSDVFEILPFKEENQYSVSLSINQEFAETDKYDPKKAKDQFENIDS